MLDIETQEKLEDMLNDRLELADSDELTMSHEERSELFNEILETVDDETASEVEVMIDE